MLFLPENFNSGARPRDIDLGRWFFFTIFISCVNNFVYGRQLNFEKKLFTAHPNSDIQLVHDINVVLISKSK